MGDDELEQRRELTIQPPVVPAKTHETIPVGENHANYLVDKITASTWVRDLGRNGKVSAPMKAAIAYSVAATLEEVHASDRRYRVSDLGLLARIATYFSPGLRPVSISISSAAPPSEAHQGARRRAESLENSAGASTPSSSRRCVRRGQSTMHSKQAGRLLRSTGRSRRTAPAYRAWRDY